MMGALIEGKKEAVRDDPTERRRVARTLRSEGRN
jgi:hypothetical protein